MMLHMRLLSMKSVTLVLMIMVALTSLAIAELIPQISSRSGGDEVDAEVGISSGKPWPCCNKCGICTRSLPPMCTCEDEVLSCHPSCNDCSPSPKRIYPQRYRCRDLVVNYCEKPCNPTFAPA